MGNTAIQTNLVTLGGAAGSGLVDDQDALMEVFRSLVKTYVPGLPNFYKGLRPIDSDELAPDCLIVQPVKDVTEMRTTAKVHTFWPFELYWVVAEDSVDACTVKSTNCAMIFRKLFSNNALNDRGTAAATNQFKTYEPYWTNSEMKGGALGVPILNGRQNGQKYLAAGFFGLTLETQKLI